MVKNHPEDADPARYLNYDINEDVITKERVFTKL